VETTINGEMMIDNVYVRLDGLGKPLRDVLDGVAYAGWEGLG
jgi:hypothetical protein